MLATLSPLRRERVTEFAALSEIEPAQKHNVSRPDLVEREPEPE